MEQQEFNELLQNAVAEGLFGSYVHQYSGEEIDALLALTGYASGDDKLNYLVNKIAAAADDASAAAGSASAAAGSASAAAGSASEAKRSASEAAAYRNEIVDVGGVPIIGKGVNLLDNWYFPNPVNQRAGKIVNAGVAWWTNPDAIPASGTSGSGGVTLATRAVTIFGENTNGVAYVGWTASGANYYTQATRAVRGYINTGYTIDRWYNAYNPANVAVLVTEQGLKMSASNTNAPYMMQRFETAFGDALVEEICTFSLLFADGSIETGSTAFPYSGRLSDAICVSNSNVLMYFQYNIYSGNLPCVVFVIRNSEKISVAAKLELGETQTLAHQDETGNWVLSDPPPNPQQELAKCQRYYQLFATQSLRPTNAQDFRPTMRTTPALGVINIGGTTYYTADANL